MNGNIPVERRQKNNIFLIITGYLLSYGAFELTAGLTGDPVIPVNAFIISAAVLTAVIIAELLFFKKKPGSIIKFLGLGKPSIKSIAVSLVITVLLFLCYPLITIITGYEFKIPGNWLSLAAGVFVMHGIAEEVLYRGYLFRKLREGRSFAKASWLAVIFFTAAHIPIIINQGLLVGGMAVLLAVVSSFPFSYLYEKGNYTVWAPAIVHSAIDTIIPILSAGEMNETASFAATLWMAASMIIPYTAFLFFRKNPTPVKI